MTGHAPTCTRTLPRRFGRARAPWRRFALAAGWMMLGVLIGGIAGCAAGAWLTLYMSYDWPVVVGGKPVGSVPPYVVIMFEMTILFGALSTLLGIAFNIARAVRLRGTIAYDPRFSNDKFGIFVPCPTDRAQSIESLLRNAGAEEVRRA